MDIMPLKFVTLEVHESYHFVAKLWTFFAIQRMERIQQRFYILNMWFLCGSKYSIVVKIWIEYSILLMWQFMDIFSERFLILTANYGFLNHLHEYLNQNMLN